MIALILGAAIIYAFLVGYQRLVMWLQTAHHFGYDEACAFPAFILIFGILSYAVGCFALGKEPFSNAARKKLETGEETRGFEEE